MKRVILTGSESTGKTQLARRLADHYRVLWAPEFCREYLTALNKTPNVTDVEPIVRGQLALEAALIKRSGAGKLLIQDTDILSTLLYARHYYGPEACPAGLTTTARGHIADLYLLCWPDVPWIPDPQRDRGGRREEMHALFAETLDEFGIVPVEIRGNWETRFRSAVAAIDKLLQD